MEMNEALKILAVILGILSFVSIIIGQALWIGAKIDDMAESFGRDKKEFKKEMDLLKKPETPKKTKRTKTKTKG